MRTLAIVAALFLTGIAAPAFADGIEKSMVRIQIANDGKSAAQICQDLKVQDIMPGTLTECEANIVRLNHLAAGNNTRPLERVYVLVYDGPAAQALAIAATEEVAEPTNRPTMVLQQPTTRTGDNSVLYALLVLALVFVIIYLAYRGRHMTSSSQDDFDDETVEEETEEAHEPAAVVETTHDASVPEAPPEPAPEVQTNGPTTAMPITPDEDTTDQPKT